MNDNLPIISRRTFLQGTSVSILAMGAAHAVAADSLLTGDFSWNASEPLVGPPSSPDNQWISIKDPSIARHEGRWHLFCTTRGTKRSHSIFHFSFEDWKDAGKVRPVELTCHPGYFCAPQAFYFAPKKKWYLICQASDESWEPQYGASFATTDDITDPASWSPVRSLKAQCAGQKAGLDFWVICDEEKAHLFFTTLDGHMWREETKLEDFPHGWSKPELVVKGDIFEASHTYKIKGKNEYLTFVEAQNGHGWRYFKAYLSKRLEGPWMPLADSREKNFASLKNVKQSSGHWTDAISHGEILRAGSDQRLEVDPTNLRLVFQGATNAQRSGKKYGEIPWRLGLLEML